MRKGVAAIWVLIGLGGCGSSKEKIDSQPGGEPFVEGSRLKARWIQPPGAPRRLVGWYDTELQASCSFRSAYLRPDLLQEGGGDFYCMPQMTSGTGDLFADAACTQLVAEIACDDIHYVELPSLDRTCDAVERYFPVGEALPGGSVYVRSSYGGGCVALDAADPQMPRSPHRLGPELPLGTFVSARLDGGGAGGRIVPRSLQAADGSAEVWGAWDSARGENVFPYDWPNVVAGYAGAIPGRWEPERFAGQSGGAFFRNASCTQKVVALEGCGTLGLRSVAADPGTATCSGYQVTYFEAGATLDASQVFEQYGATCGPHDASGATGYQQFIAVGAEVPASAFVGAQSFEQGSDRVWIRSPGTDAGPIRGREDFFDSQRGAPCGAVLAADGILRCLPLRAAGVTFGDAACSHPVLARLATTGSCPSEPLPQVVGVDAFSASGGCDPTYRRHMFPVGGIHSGAVYSGTGPADCQVVPADPMLTAYDLGSELPPTDFVALATSTPF